MKVQQALEVRGVPDSYERQENHWLLAHILNCSATDLKLMSDFELSIDQETAYLNSIQRLSFGEPLAYILGNQPFWNLDLLVNQYTLIPRPDSEMLVQAVLDLPLGVDDVRVLDLGTGTGAIGLSIASERPSWQCILTDAYAECLILAQQNAMKHNINNAQFALGDWYGALLQDEYFDVIVSNPPYIAEYDRHLIDLLQFEPRSALVAGSDGLSDILQIVRGAKGFLRPNGYVLIEHGWQQAHAVREIFYSSGFKNVKTLLDFGGNERVTLGQYVS